MGRDSGLTAFEVAVSLAIIALMAAVSMPSFLSWLQAHRLRGSAINLMSDLEMAKVRAIREGSFVAVEFRASNYQVLLDNGDGTERLIQDRILPTGVNVSLDELTDNRMRFNSRGLVQDLAAAELIPLVNSAGRKTVRVNRLGSVRID